MSRNILCTFNTKNEPISWTRWNSHRDRKIWSIHKTATGFQAIKHKKAGPRILGTFKSYEMALSVIEQPRPFPGLPPLCWEQLSEKLNKDSE